METGKTLRGSAQLVFDTVDGITHIVEGMYRNIAASPLPLGRSPEGPARGVAGLVHRSIRGINGATRHVSDRALAGIAPVLDNQWPPGPYREAAVAALNGVCGDYLARSANPLAIAMRIRAFLPLQDCADAPRAAQDTVNSPIPGKRQPLDGLFEVQKRPVELSPRPRALQERSFSPGGRILVMVHGLSMNDREWTANGHNHAETLAVDSAYTPVYVLYNSGLHISTNGRELSDRLNSLAASWPVPVESISFIGFSMGGLVARSAMHIANESGQAWLSKVDKAVYVGTPHHGAAMERGGYWLQKILTYSPYTAPLSVLGRIRSAGIIDLRHGNVQDADWQHHDAHENNADTRRPTPLVEGVEHYAIAATLSKRPGQRTRGLLGDGLVHPSSATGRHPDPDLNLAFDASHTRVFYNLGHLGMLHDARVRQQLLQWLGGRDSEKSCSTATPAPA